METLGFIGEQLESHVSAAATAASKKVEKSLFDVDQMNLSKDEKQIYECLNHEPLHVEQIIADTNLMPGSVNAGLISLRLKGLIKQLPGNMFIKR